MILSVVEVRKIRHAFLGMKDSSGAQNIPAGWLNNYMKLNILMKNFFPISVIIFGERGRNMRVA